MPGRPLPARFLRVRHALFVLLLLSASSGCKSASPVDSSPRSQRCVTCHLAEYQGVSHPPHAGVRPTTCGSCHLDTSWHPYRLDHSWPLEGAHSKANCFDCHRGEPRQFEGTSKQCLSCHGDDRDRANQQLARHAQFGTSCQTCHSTALWQPTLPHEGAEGNAELAPETRGGAPTPPIATVHSTATGAGRKTPAVKKLPPPAPLSPTPSAPAPPPAPTTPAPTTPTRKPKAKPDTVTGASPAWRK